MNPHKMLREQPLLSIIITGHNSALTLPATLQSLDDALSNDFSNCEVLLINDSSNDNTGEILADFAHDKPQVTVYEVTFSNIGRVRQFAIDHCQGDYITMLDGDDLLKNGSLTDICHFLCQQAPDLLITKLHEVRNLATIDTQWKGLLPETLTRHEAISRFLIHKDFQAHLIGQFIRRDILQKLTIPAYNCYEDFYVFPEILLGAVNISFSASSHYLYLKHKGSLSNSPSVEKIHNMIVCTGRMNTLFGKQYSALIACHWLDIKLKQDRWITDPSQRQLVDQQARRALNLDYFLHPLVRFSYKKKALKLLWKK